MKLKTLNTNLYEIELEDGQTLRLSEKDHALKIVAKATEDGETLDLIANDYAPFQYKSVSVKILGY